MSLQKGFLKRAWQGTEKTEARSFAENGLSWEVLHGVGVHGVGGTFPFLIFFSFFFAFCFAIVFFAFRRFFFILLRFSVILLEDTGKQLQFPAKWGVSL